MSPAAAPRGDNPLAAIFGARSVAFVGASNKPTTMGTIQMINCLRSSFSGSVIPVHPSEPTVLGLPAYRRLSDLPEPVDLAVLVVPTTAVLQVVSDAIQRGIRQLVVTTAGFREVGAEGGEREQALRDMTRRAGVRFVGPNCIGVLNAVSGLNTTFFPYRHASGPLSIASQSGTYVTQTLDQLARLGVGLAKAISVGNATDIDLADCLDYFATDPDTHAVALYVEGIRDGQRFLQAARRCTARKPVVALYVGGTDGGARSGASHTGALSGPDGLYEGMFHQAGILRAATVPELYQWGWTLATQPLPAGPNMAILTHSGGPATSMADAVSRAGLRLPRFEGALLEKIQRLIPATGAAANPIDLTFNLNPRLLGETLPRLLLESPTVDGLLMHGMQGSTFLADMNEFAGGLVEIDVDQMTSMTEYLAQPLLTMPQEYGKPIVMSSFYDRRDSLVRLLQDHRIPLFQWPEEAVRAMAALVRCGQLRRQRSEGPGGAGTPA